MTEQVELKLVVTYDRTRNEYSIAAHNLSPEAADKIVEQWKSQLHPECSFIVLSQTREHRTDQPQDCRPCRRTVVRSAHLEPLPKFVRRIEP